MTEAKQGFGTLLQRKTKVCSVLVTGSANHAIKFTAVPEGLVGDSISVQFVNPGGTGLLVITVPTANHVLVTLARTGGVIISTAKLVIAAIKAHVGASALVRVENSGVSTGAEVVEAVDETNLADGSNVETYHTLGEVGNISGPTLTLGTKEVTNQDSADGWREHVATTLDCGELTFEINNIPDSVSQGYILGILKDIERKIKRSFKLIFSDANYWTFNALTTKFSTSGPVDGKQSASITIKVTGASVLTGV